MELQEHEGKNIILVGMMGAGKSYIGKKLAKLASHFSFTDTDIEIEKQEGLEISEIFEQKSQEYFRKIECELIKKIAQNPYQIIATGGGSFENQETASVLSENGLVFYLKASPQELFNRIKGEKHRPILKNEMSVEKIDKILKEREKNYLKAHFTIETDKRPAYKILNDIIKEYENHARK